MSVSGISGYSSSLSLVDLLSGQETEEDSSSILSTSTTAARADQLLAEQQAAGRRAKNAYTTSASSGIGQAALKRALSEMSVSYGDKVTFADIAAYQKELEEKFSTGLRSELEKSGVPLETEFTLNISADGKIQVQCDDPVAKEKIQAFLEENPDVCEQFGYIQALANLERAKQSPAAASTAWQSVQNAKAQLQTQAVEMFFGDALSSGMNFSSLAASFGSVTDALSASGATSFYAGIDYTV